MLLLQYSDGVPEGLGRCVFHSRQASIQDSCTRPSSAPIPQTLGAAPGRPCGLRTYRRVADCAVPGSKIIGGDDCSIKAVAVSDPATREITPPVQGGVCRHERVNEGSAGWLWVAPRCLRDLRHPTNSPASPVTVLPAFRRNFSPLLG